MAAMPRTIGWGLEQRPRTEPSIAEQVGMHRPSPGDYIRELGAKTIDSMVAAFDRCTPRQGVEL